MRTRWRNMAVVLAALAATPAFAAPAARAQDACVDAAADTLDVGFYDDFIPVSYSAEKDSTGGPGEHRGYEADLLTAFEAMGGIALVRHPIGGALACSSASSPTYSRGSMSGTVDMICATFISGPLSPPSARRRSAACFSRSMPTPR